MRKAHRWVWLAVLVAGSWTPLAAQDEADTWLRECRENRSRNRVRHCEVRSYTVPAGTGTLAIDAGPNGGVSVKPWNRNDIRVLAKVQAQARSTAAAEELAEDVRVDVSGRTIRSTGPRRTGRNEGWSVSFEVWAPARTDLRLSSTNGGLVAEGIQGELDARTTNGSVTLREATGRVRAQTVNGAVEIVLAQGAWEGGEIRAGTTNGAIRMIIPTGFSAQLEARTTNGGVSVDAPVRITESSRRRLIGQLGEGGPLIRLTTTNGGISIRER